MRPPPRWIAPLKLNVWALAGALVGIVALCLGLLSEVIGTTIPTLISSDVADEVRGAALALLTHVAALNFAVPVIAGIVSWGIKLLDDGQEPEPGVPLTAYLALASAHRAALGGDTEIRDLETEAAQHGEAK